MKLRYFGDSYDIVKRSLLRWLSPLGPWAAHPMFTESTTREEAEAFSRFLGVPLVSRAILDPRTNRPGYLEPARSWSGHVFLDPDTGLRLQEVGGRRGCAFVFAREVREILQPRTERLALIFDQSRRRGKESEDLFGKLRALSEVGILGFAYRSHAAFLFLGSDRELVRSAQDLLLVGSHLPASRVVGL